MAVRDHQPIVFDKFNGLWNRGDIENTPMDHFSDCVNLRYFGTNSFGSRYGIGPSQSVVSPLSSILRIYNYPTFTNGQTLLILTTGGNIYHLVNATTIFGPILTIPAMTDFGFVSYAGRAYITPFGTSVVNGMNIETGLSGEFLYVYKGDGTAARHAGGTTPTSVLTVTNGIAGFNDAGTHVFGYVYETDTGYLTPPGGLVAFDTDGVHALNFTGVANSPDTFVVAKHIVASAVIPNFNGDVNGFDLFFIPGATIPNNTVTTLNGISFFDQDLLEDATHLLDNFTQIPAGVGLCIYHNRLVSWGENANISTARVSAVGEPEAISQISGLCQAPPEGNNPLTNGFELRDVLYLTKRNKTIAFVDNGGDPTDWPLSPVDAALGTGVHGVATVVDQGSQNIDFAVVATYKGLALFNGRYNVPELSWKIQSTWTAQNFKNNFRIIQVVNDSVGQNLYCVTTDRNVLYGNYMNGLDPKGIRWAPWTFKVFVNSLALNNINDLIFGIDQV